MRRSWRIGVDPGERTQLVTIGAFSTVRNPIFVGMAFVWFGLALIEPNVLSMVAVLTLLAGIELQVRRVEEPYLLAVHRVAYRRYAAKTGRFVPWFGRLRS
jgi:protein-S-isoprenylcysteine O-methyltransferase Ste14